MTLAELIAKQDQQERNEFRFIPVPAEDKEVKQLLQQIIHSEKQLKNIVFQLGISYEKIIKEEQKRIETEKEMIRLLSRIDKKEMKVIIPKQEVAKQIDIQAIINPILEAINNIQFPKLEEKKIEPPQITTAKIHRVKPRWIVATNPQRSGTELIRGTIDGTNATFYLPSVPIKNSEQVRLNRGSPLAFGEDYTLTDNRLVFTTNVRIGSKMEIRFMN